MDPWGEEREDLRNALQTLAIVQALSALQAQVAATKGKRIPKVKKFELEQFHLGEILKWGGKRPKRKQTQQEMLAIVRMIAGATKATITKVGEGFDPTLDLYGGPALGVDAKK